MECEAFYVFWAEIGRRMNKYARYLLVSGNNDTMESGVSSFSLDVHLCISFSPAGL